MTVNDRTIPVPAVPAPPDCEKGWARERDMGFWVPVARGRNEDGRFRIEQLCWYQPYRFVDTAAGILTGRETYGFTKNPGGCHPSRGAHQDQQNPGVEVKREA